MDCSYAVIETELPSSLSRVELDPIEILISDFDLMSIQTPLEMVKSYSRYGEKCQSCKVHKPEVFECLPSAQMLTVCTFIVLQPIKRHMYEMVTEGDGK